jgi:hypothetical protein
VNDSLASGVAGLAFLVCVICFILVVIKMFQRGAVGMAIACVVLSMCCGLGGLVAFVYGWTKARQWDMSNLMTVWSVAVAINVVVAGVNPAPYRLVQERIYVIEGQPVR